MTREELVEEVGRNIGSSLGAKLAQSSWGGDAEARRFQRAAVFRREPRSASPIHIPGHLVAQRPRRFDPRTAPDAVARRFLASYGPATTRTSPVGGTVPALPPPDNGWFRSAKS